MHQANNKVAAIHDLSGFGRCSLAVIIPLLSVLKKQVCPVPTTILSSHTGGLGEVAMRDLPGYVSEALHHYQTLELTFAGIYSGYLGKADHIADCLAFIQAFPEALKVVDPVMGDHGKPYRHMSAELIASMKDLVRVADLITPNMTEVGLLLNEPYLGGSLSLGECKQKLRALSELGPRQVIITGVRIEQGQIVNMGYDRLANQYYGIPCYYSDVSYPGTGDIFAAIVTGYLLDGLELPKSIEKATRFLEYVIQKTYASGSDTRYGVALEEHLDWFFKEDISYEYIVY